MIAILLLFSLFLHFYFPFFFAMEIEFNCMRVKHTDGKLFNEFVKNELQKYE